MSELLIAALLLLLSGFFSGSILGLMSLSSSELKRKSELGDHQARRIYRIRKNGNLLLVTLIFGNIAVNSILAIYLGSITDQVAGAIVATLLITIFGEILPMSIFSRYNFQIGSRVAQPIQFLIYLMLPITYPLAWLLDKLVGTEAPKFYSKRELLQLIEDHKESPDQIIEADEERIARGALTFGDKAVGEAMTPKSVVFSVDEKEIINSPLIDKLEQSGFSRFPVFSGDKDNIVGILYLHQLASPKTFHKKVSEVAYQKVYFVSNTDKLDHTLRHLLRSKNHLFIVNDSFHEMLGIITLEDILEEIMQWEIVGEFDKDTNMRALAQDQAKAHPVEIK